MESISSQYKSIKTRPSILSKFINDIIDGIYNLFSDKYTVTIAHVIGIIISPITLIFHGILKLISLIPTPITDIISFFFNCISIIITFILKLILPKCVVKYIIIYHILFQSNRFVSSATKSVSNNNFISIIYHTPIKYIEYYHPKLDRNTYLTDYSVIHAIKEDVQSVEKKTLLTIKTIQSEIDSLNSNKNVINDVYLSMSNTTISDMIDGYTYKFVSLNSVYQNDILIGRFKRWSKKKRMMFFTNGDKCPNDKKRKAKYMIYIWLYVYL